MLAHNALSYYTYNVHILCNGIHDDSPMTNSAKYIFKVNKLANTQLAQNVFNGLSARQKQ